MFMWESEHGGAGSSYHSQGWWYFWASSSSCSEAWHCSTWTEAPCPGFCEQPLTGSQKMLLCATARTLLRESASRSQIVLSSGQRLVWKCLLQLKNLETVTSLSSVTCSSNSIVPLSEETVCKPSLAHGSCRNYKSSYYLKKYSLVPLFCLKP